MASSIDSGRLAASFSFAMLLTGNLLAGVTYTVDKVADTGTGSLRDAIQQANLNPGADTIAFAIASGAQVISPASALPPITEQLTIDGTTQIGYTTAPLIEIDGSSAGTTSGLILLGDGCLVRGLIVNGFGDPGSSAIEFHSSNNTVQLCYVGTDATATSVVPNYYGIRFVGGGNNIIGGINAGNVIAGNHFTDLRLENSTTATIQGNLIGTDVTGTTALAAPFIGFLGLDAGRGIDMTGSSDSVLGGGGAGEGNVISGHTQDGVFAVSCANMTVKNNKVGMDITGTAAVPNLNFGVWIRQSANVTVGSPASADRNILSGNKNQTHLRLDLCSGTVQGNYIGPDVTGMSAPSNDFSGGMILENCSGVVVGGTSAGARNVIAGNQKFGLTCRLNCTTITVQGNYFGVNKLGTAALVNKEINLAFSGSGTNSFSTIGGTDPGAGNLISGSKGGDGINIGGHGAITIQGNYIGTDVTGTFAIENFNHGISVSSGGGSLPIQIGGNTAAARNLCSGNGLAGVSTHNGATKVNIQGNYIGTDVTGMLAVPNGLRANFGGTYPAVLVDSGSSATIGGLNSGEPNLISGNKWHGIQVEGSARQTFIYGNTIGLNITQTAPLPNEGDGVVFLNSVAISGQHVLGGLTAAHRNYIAGNLGNGVTLDSATTVSVLGNYIGTLPDGTTAAGNGGDGVHIVNGGAANVIGGTAAGALNLLAANSGAGIYMQGCSSSSALGNYIGTKIDGTTALANGGDGVWIDTGTIANVIGGTTTAARNVIAANLGSGVKISGGNANRVEGNLIGTKLGGLIGLGNGSIGVSITGGSNHVVGSPSNSAARNLIAANNGAGVSVTGGTSCTIAANYIGTDITGAAALPNNGDGVYVSSGPGHTIGGSLPAARSIICANGGYAVQLDGATACSVLGNRLSVDVNGNALPNSSDGVRIVGGSGNVIGLSAAGNLISANPGYGISITNSASNTVQGNYIGTNPAGTAPMANALDGLSIDGGSGNLVGGSTAGTANIIGGNGGVGITVTNSNSNAIAGNLIGVQPSGTAALPNGSDGIVVTGGAGNTIGLTGTNGGNQVSSNPGSALLLTNTSTATVQNNRFGTQANGILAMYNGNNPLVISGGSGNLIGGTSAAARNIIATSSTEALLLDGTAGNTVSANYINVSADGTQRFQAPFPLHISGGGNNIIGGTTAGERNVISGADFGTNIVLDASTSYNVIEGNYIGSDASGTSAFSGGISGIQIGDGSTTNTVGGSVTGAGNVISGHEAFGILMFNTSGNTIAGNLIGTDATGNVALPNKGFGIEMLSGANSNLIGGTTSAARNVISGNDSSTFGFGIDMDESDFNTVQGNYIGLNAAGTAAIPNATNGIFVHNCFATSIGGSATGAENVISGNGIFDFEDAGIVVFQADHTVIQGNRIGTDAAGSAALGNLGDGVALELSSDCQMGGTNINEGNLVSGNKEMGVYVSGAANPVIAGNLIGTNAAGSTAVPNLKHGIWVDEVAFPEDADLDGGLFGPGNVIAGNLQNGIYINGSGAAGFTVTGNIIGTNAAGTAAVANGLAGIALDEGTTSNTLGGTSPAEANLISGNAAYGIVVANLATSGTRILGNRLGTNAAGNALLANATANIRITSATAVQVGGINTTEFNTIAGSTVGVLVDPISTTTLILGNSITSATVAGIDLGNDGPTVNDSPDSDQKQNYPILTGVTSDSGVTTITGTLLSAPATIYRVEFFRNDVAGPGNFGEGQALIGSANVSTNPLGVASFTATFAGTTPRNQLVAATATNLNGGTSEFSPDFVAVPVELSTFNIE